MKFVVLAALADAQPGGAARQDDAPFSFGYSRKIGDTFWWCLLSCAKNLFVPLVRRTH